MKQFLLIAFIICALPALAKTPAPEIIGTFGKWTAYKHADGKTKPVCYIAAPPVKSEGKYKKRGAVFILVTHRPAEKAFNVVSYVAGYTYDTKKPVIMVIDTMKYPLLPARDMAWTPNAKTDAILTEAIKMGNKMTVTGMSSKGTITKDMFNLAGSTKAMKAIDKACGKK